jgi:hypothetical protein
MCECQGFLARLAFVLSSPPLGLFGDESPGRDGGLSVKGLVVLLLALALVPTVGTWNASRGTVAFGINTSGGAPTNSDVQNFVMATRVPEPESIMLFGSGMIGLALLIRRRARK